MPAVSAPAAKHFRFGPYVLDGEARELRCGGRHVDIEPKTFELLCLLASRPQHTFTKDEIIAALWPGRVVSDSVIAQCVRKARQATGDTVSDQAVIKTVHGVGYRFTARLTDDESPGEGLPPAILLRARPLLWAATIALVVAAVMWLPQPSEPEQRGQIVVAALPASETGSLSEAMVAGLDSLLSRGVAEYSDIQIITPGRTQRMLYSLGLDPEGNDQELLAALNQSLGAEYLMRTRIDDGEDGYRIQASVISPDGTVEEIEPPVGDIVTMVRGFSLALARELGTSWREAEGIPVLSADNFVNEAYARALNALLAGENQTAALLFESVLNLDPDLLFARYELGNAMWHLGDHDQARGHYEAALEAAMARNSPRLAGHSLTMIGVLDWQAGDFEQAEGHFEQSLEHYEAISDHHGAASSLGNLGNLADSRGNLDRAADLHSQARQRFRAANDQVGESAAYTNLAVISRLRSRLHEAHRQQKRAVEIQRALGIGSMLVRSLTYLAAIECELGRCDLSGELLDEAAELAERQGNRHGLAEIELERAHLALRKLQPTTAAVHARQAGEAFESLQMPAGEALALSALAKSALLDDDPALARQLLEQAETLDAGASKPRDRAARELLGVRVALATADFDTAETILETLQASSDRVVVAKATAARAELHWQRHQVDDAIGLWRAALEELEHFDDPRVRAQVRTRLARALIELDRLDEVEALLTRVRDWSRSDPAAIIQMTRLHLARAEMEQARELLEIITQEAAEPLADPDFQQILAALE